VSVHRECRYIKGSVQSSFTVDTLDLSDKPQYIWNCNESGKSFMHDPVRVITAKGASSLSLAKQAGSPTI